MKPHVPFEAWGMAVPPLAWQPQRCILLGIWRLVFFVDTHPHSRRQKFHTMADISSSAPPHHSFLVLFESVIYNPATWSLKGYGSGLAAAPRGATAGISKLTFSYLGPARAIIVRYPNSPSPQSPPDKRKEKAHSSPRRRNKRRKGKERTGPPPPPTPLSPSPRQPGPAPPSPLPRPPSRPALPSGRPWWGGKVSTP